MIKIVLFQVKSASKVNVKHMLTVDNIKDYKKVLKTNKNVLTLFSKDGMYKDSTVIKF